MHNQNKNFGWLPIPKYARVDASNPPPWSLWLNLLFAAASTATVANIYYCQPILNQLRADFKTDVSTAGHITTLAQAGYAVGIALIAPLGDLLRRRQLILAIVFIAATLSIGLAITTNLHAFQALTFLVGAFTVTPQILIPLTAHLAPLDRRSRAISITLAGLLLGILGARVLSGIIAEYVTWRIVYWVGVGVQYSILILLYLFLPNVPPVFEDTHNVTITKEGEATPTAKNELDPISRTATTTTTTTTQTYRNPEKPTYFGILLDLVKYLFKYPLLVQSGLIQALAMATFTNFWNTLTFVLGMDPYNYNTLQIGLFGLVGILGVCTAPFAGRLIDRYVPWISVLVGVLLFCVAIPIALAAGQINIGALVVTCFITDVGIQIAQVANATRIYALDPLARSRLNSIFMIMAFLGAVMGTGAGTVVYERHGWQACMGLNLGWLALALIVCCARGPYSTKWIGWDGGANMRKPTTPNQETLPHQQQQQQQREQQGGVMQDELAPAPEGLIAIETLHDAHDDKHIPMNEIRKQKEDKISNGPEFEEVNL